MPYPTPPNPGTVVPSGSLVTPSGSMGAQGPTGPTAVSTDAGNQATLGSDSRIYVPDPTPIITSVRLRSFNALGNPNCEVDQRNVGAAVTNPATGSFLLDRYNLTKVGSMVINSRQVAATLVYVPGTNFWITGNVLSLTLATQEASLAAGDLWCFNQFVEGPPFRELIGDVSSVSVLVSGPAGLKFSIALRDNPATKSLVKLCTIPATGWQLIQLPNVPVFPAGNFSTSPGAVGYILSVTLACGTTYTAPTADTWQTGNFVGAPGMSNWAASAVNSVFQVGFIQHEPGSQCTTLIDKPFTQNYDECLRYYQKTYNYGVKAGTVDGNGQLFMPVFSGVTAVWAPISFKKTMAKTPTVNAVSPNTGSGNAVRNVTSSADVATTSTQSPGDAGFGGFNLGQAPGANSNISFHYTADTGW